ncbi:MAG: thiamine phosphate synthase [bacterium]
MNKQDSLRTLSKAGLYLVTSSEFSTLPVMEVLERFLKAGGKLFQLREKAFAREQLLETAKMARKLADQYGAVFILNDDVDVALAVNADGVHLGQDDMPIKDARKLLGNDLIIGVSTHNIHEAIAAQEDGADYINIGPVFPTQTKAHAKALGAEGIELILPYVKVPFTFMGGIKEENIPALLKYDPAAVAMVTEITRASDIESKVKKLLSISLCY